MYNFFYLVSIIGKSVVYFAREDALSGSILQTLLYAQPSGLFAVPRIWEKIEEKIKDQVSKSNFIRKKICNFFE